MDACTYKQITGFSNYEGFKSLLKNGVRTGVYRCDDDTIIFNKIIQVNFTTDFLSLDINQVAVLLTCGLQLDDAFGPTSLIPNELYYFDVNGNEAKSDQKALILGTVMTQTASPLWKVGGLITVAIFDLF